MNGDELNRYDIALAFMARLQGSGGKAAPQIFSGMRPLDLGHLFGRALSHDLAPLFPAFGPKVDEVICRLDDIHVMLDDDDCVAAVHEAVKDMDQLPDIIKMQAGRRFIQEIEDVPGL